MLYLVMLRMRQPAPPQVLDAFLAQCDYMRNLEKKGTVKFFAPFAELNGGVSIIDAESNEKLTETLVSSPMYPFADAQVHPLISADFGDALVRGMKASMGK